jgi:hypothetical protein
MAGIFPFCRGRITGTGVYTLTKSWEIRIAKLDKSHYFDTGTMKPNH